MVLLDFGKTFGIKKTDQILDGVISAVNQWPQIAKEIEIPKNKIDAINVNLRITELQK
ncbi:MAG: hypothetical protein JKY42_07835 [Flavobacteriales bacterium]|nr:hypothetical protein [Flavobacteriales bacterium]